jgi:hypothetical protein
MSQRCAQLAGAAVVPVASIVSVSVFIAIRHIALHDIERF